MEVQLVVDGALGTRAGLVSARERPPNHDDAFRGTLSSTLKSAVALLRHVAVCSCRTFRPLIVRL
jgi:hypothetical protein